jgi:putative ABC transport system permease protein
MDEVRLALRRVTKRPGAALASIITLGAAIGAAAATTSLLSAVLLHPLAVRAPDRLVVVGERVAGGRIPDHLQNSNVYPVYPHVRDSGIFESVAAGGPPQWVVLVNAAGFAQQAQVYFSSFNFFDVLGVQLARGRTFTEDEDRRGAPLVVILSDQYWHATFGGNPQVLGTQIQVSDKPAVIVGIAPPGFRGVQLSVAPDIYLPLNAIGDAAGMRANFFADADPHDSPTAWVTIIGRLRPDATRASTAAQVATLSGPPRFESERYGLTDANTAAVPAVSRAGLAQFSTLLAATVALLLLIGCATVGGLLLVRTEARREEFAMCLALGASRVRLARGVAVEGGWLALAGAVLALPMAKAMFAGARAFQLPGGVEIGLLDLSIDSQLLVAAVCCAVAGALLIALVACAFIMSTDTADALRSRAGATPRTTGRLTRTMLVTAQVAVAVVLLTGAGLFARSLIASLRLNPGFDTSKIVSVDMMPRPSGYIPSRAMPFFDEVRQRLSANPALRAVSMTERLGGMSREGSLNVDGQERKFPNPTRFTAVDEHYFQTIGLRVSAGRDFSRLDSERAPLVGIVSESFGRTLANGASPIGHRISMMFGRLLVIEIVGVVPDVITDVSDLEPFVLYLPLAQQSPTTNHTLVFHASGDVTAAKREALATIRQIDPHVVPGVMVSIDDLLSMQMASQHFGVVILSALGAIAMLLTVLGTYVLAESMAVLRMREMGIRAALGASGRQLGAIVLAETARLVGFGLLVGLLLAWMGASTIRAFLFRVQPLDPATLAGVAATILLLALAVSLRPALRAARVDLGTVLKEE